MAEQHTAEELERRREEFLVQAKAAFDQMFGQNGKNGLVTFTERGDRACEATDALARWLLQERLAWDEAKEPGVQVDCPICGGPVRHESVGVSASGATAAAGVGKRSTADSVADLGIHQKQRASHGLRPLSPRRTAHHQCPGRVVDQAV